ncbi:hypothetical protein ZIOFF_073759 [Zingiber officinale]|uniref:RING-CH-type domain-containing protein n=1 Tax=Zingiber officinale TaxID=94328 RepID=A0A8J5C1L7_ZINOF|nr:hypothetical protein ZIOFF_073759 [Zingiber officinale]
MGDHFVLLVDRLLTESTLEAAIEGMKHGSSIPLPALEADYSPTKKIIGDGVFTGETVECRICGDEDEDIHMEVPCSCCGSLKLLIYLKILISSMRHFESWFSTLVSTIVGTLQFAHRKCVQKWCNEKGDTTCEICLQVCLSDNLSVFLILIVTSFQQFKPGYTAPPKLFLYGTRPMHFRGNWEVSSQNIHNQQYFTMTQTDHVFSRPNYGGTALSDRNITYCRIAATMVMIILILWHFISFITNGVEECSVLLFTLLLLRVVGVVLPLYVTLRAVSIFYQRKQQAMHISVG